MSINFDKKLNKKKECQVISFIILSKFNYNLSGPGLYVRKRRRMG